jgi:hypothetical protein
LRSDAAIDRHVALLNWDPTAAAKSDWLVIAQAAESIGLIGDSTRASSGSWRSSSRAGCAAQLAAPAARSHDSRDGERTGRRSARLVIAPRFAEAVAHPAAQSDDCPTEIRGAAAFAIGVLSEPGAAPPGDVNFFAIYDSP